MSILRFAATRLHWDPARGGSATRKGRTVRLTEPPDLGAGRVYAVDWVPQCIASITRAVHDSADDMRPDEIEQAHALLLEFVPSQAGAL